jgi:hypothetical protein
VEVVATYNEDSRKAVYKMALIKWGEANQSVVAIEELSECQKEICKHLRGTGDVKHMAVEIADSIIMLEQLQMIFGIGDLVAKYMDSKIERLDSRINEDRNGKRN